MMSLRKWRKRWRFSSEINRLHWRYELKSWCGRCRFKKKKSIFGNYIRRAMFTAVSPEPEIRKWIWQVQIMTSAFVILKRDISFFLAKFMPGLITYKPVLVIWFWSNIYEASSEPLFSSETARPDNYSRQLESFSICLPPCFSFVSTWAICEKTIDEFVSNNFVCKSCQQL